MKEEFDALFAEHQKLLGELQAMKALAQPEQEPVAFEMDWPDYHVEAMGCGLEDRNITDRYEAMQYGWDEAIERIAERLPEVLYTTPPQRTWVGLDDTDLAVCDTDGVMVAKYWERVLKEKNT